MPHQCTNCDRTFADGSKEMLSGCPECGGTKFQFRPDGFDGGSDTTGESTGQTGTASTSDPVDDSPPEPTDRPGDSMTRTVGNAAATVRDLVSGSAGSDATQAQAPAEKRSGSATSTADAGDDDIIVAESEPVTDEDTAQADARSQLAEPEEMPEPAGSTPAGTIATTDDSEPVDGPTETDSVADAPTNVQSSERDGAPDGSAAPGTDRTVADEPDADRAVADEPDAERADRPDLSELRKELNDQFESIRVVEPGQYELNLMELYDREEYIIALQEDGRYSIQVPETWRQADA